MNQADHRLFKGEARLFPAPSPSSSCALRSEPSLGNLMLDDALEHRAVSEYIREENIDNLVSAQVDLLEFGYLPVFVGVGDVLHKDIHVVFALVQEAAVDFPGFALHRDRVAFSLVQQHGRDADALASGHRHARISTSFIRILRNLRNRCRVLGCSDLAQRRFCV